jgi:hypothetical protein
VSFELLDLKQGLWGLSGGLPGYEGGFQINMDGLVGVVHLIDQYFRGGAT